MKKSLFSKLLPVSIFFLTLTACNGTKSDPVVKEDVYPTFNKIATNLVENGQSEYKIVLPAVPTEEETMAGNELQTFIAESSGVTIELVSENTIDVNLNGKYISVGETGFVALAGMKLSKDELGEAGFKMKTVNDTVIISGYHGTNFYGSLYGVYDFMKYTIGFEVYAADEIYYEKLDTINLYDFDWTYRPSFDLRCIEYRACNADRTYERRLRFIQNSKYWCSYTHTNVSTYLPVSTYGSTHPEYYGTTFGTSQVQLCYSDEGCFNALVEAVQLRLARYPNTEYCMLGQEDNWNYCKCEKCMAAIKKFGSLGGLELDFTNRVGEKVDEWLHQAFPGRKVTYVFFAYNSSLEPPVKDTNSGFAKYHEDVYVYENTGVMLAPIGMDFGQGMHSSTNESTTTTMDKWSWLFNNKNSFVWSYCIQSRSNFFHLPNFGVQREYYKYYQKIGTKMLYDQGCYQMNTPALQTMRTYISSKMMWNTDFEYYDLAYDFMKHYYGPAGDAMIEYLNFIVSYYSYLRDVHKVTGAIFMMIDDVTYWPLSVVNSMLSIFDKALEAIKPLMETDLERYGQFYDRIQIERCSPLYMICKFYLSSLSQNIKDEYLDDLEYYTKLFDIKGTQEGAYDVAGLIEGWRNQ